MPTFLVALELRLSYLAQYANQDAGEQMVQSDAVRRSGTWSLGRRIAGGRLGRSSRRVGYVAGTQGIFADDFAVGNSGFRQLS